MNKPTASILPRVLMGTAVSALLSFATAADVAADTYVFDPAHTEIRFTWSHLGVSRMSGRALAFDGTLSLDKAAPEKSTLDVKVETSGLWTHVDKLTEHLKGKEFFDAATYPGITFKSTKVERTGDKTAKVTGDMTIHGVTRPATFDVTLNFDGAHPMTKKPTVGFSAKTTVKRSDFGMGAYVPAVSDDIVIDIETELNARN